jgi:multiple sugar transport system ATP-binding protein
MTMADRVVVMHAGRIEQAADPITLYEKPRNLFVAAFIGAPSMNFIEGGVVEQDGALVFKAPGGVDLPVPADRQAAYRPVAGTAVVLGIRPEHAGASGNPATGVPLKVGDVEPLGPHTLLIGKVGDAPFTAQVMASTRAAPDDTVPVPFDLAKIHLFRKDTGEVVAP